MSQRKQFTVHIDAPGGARFSTFHSEEEVRQDLIEYWNCYEHDGPDDDVPDDITLDDIKEKIEEVRSVSIDETWLPAERVWACVIDTEYGTSVTVHTTYRGALDGANYGFPEDIPDCERPDDNEEYRKALVEHYDKHARDSWFHIQEAEIQS